MRAALAIKSSPCKIFRLARAAATQSGEAEWVEVIDPGAYKSIMSALPITAAIGKDELMPLPQAIRSGWTP